MPETRPYVVREGKTHHDGGTKKIGGEIVFLTETQFAAWKDKFSDPEREVANLRKQLEAQEAAMADAKAKIANNTSVAQDANAKSPKNVAPIAQNPGEKNSMNAAPNTSVAQDESAKTPENLNPVPQEPKGKTK